MNVDNELSKMLCIKNMDEDGFKKWECIKNMYAPMLDEGPILRPIAYTYHDYSHHCYNIYKIISKIILRKPDLTDQEWFLLDIAVLLHDFSMTQANFDRLVHSRQSADWLLEEMKGQTVISQNLSPSEAEAVALIIEAHSDCKKMVANQEKIDVNTLENPSIQEEMDCDGAQPVRAKFLAAVLRVADECDVTRNRLGTADFERLDETNSEQKYSKEQWFQLKCFKSLERNGENLILNVDDAYVLNETDESRNDIKSRIKNVVTKIRKQINYVREKVIIKDEYSVMFPLRNVKVNSKMLDESFIRLINEGQMDSDEPDFSIPVLDSSLEKKIADKIDKEGLLVQGHYIVTDTCCERDWIDLRDIVADKDLSEQIIEKIVREIKEKYDSCREHPIILGMEDVGLGLASRIAYRLHYPFSYLIPCNFNREKCSEQERYIDLTPYDKIILITDAAATFQTLGNTCNHYKILDKVCKIYTILYRKPSDKKFLHQNAKKLAENLTTCCRKGTMDVHDRLRCPDRGKSSCIAKNK